MGFHKKGRLWDCFITFRPRFYPGSFHFSQKRQYFDILWRRRRKQAENISKYCTKGTQVAVEGRIQTRSYDAQDGTKRYVTEIIADNVTFLGGKGATASDNNFVGGGSDIVTTDISEDPFKDFASEVALSDDDLPF